VITNDLDLRTIREVVEDGIFTPTERQRRQSAHLRWMLVNCPDASTIGVRAVIRQGASS